MVRAGNIFDSRKLLKDFGASLQFEKGIEKTVMWYLFSKITPSLFTLKEGSTSHPDPLSSGAREETALLGAQNRYALRLADHQRSSPCCAGWDRLGIAVYSLQLIVYSLQLISWLFADNLQISCDFLGGFEEYV